MKDIKVTDSVKYIGVDDHDIDLFESQYVVPNGVSYNSYVILDEKVAVMDTVDARKTDEWLVNLEEALDGRNVDYIVVSHMEPDHAASLQVLAEKYPDRHYTGLDLTPAMIEQAKKKNIPNTTFVVGDCENFPFEKDSFDAIICSMSFHHYPDPQAFFDSVKRCLRPNGRLILRDVTSDNKVLVWLMNTLEMPLANICGHGDVQVPTRDVVIKCCKKAGLKVEKFEIRKGMRMHCVVRKPMGKAIGNER